VCTVGFPRTATDGPRWRRVSRLDARRRVRRASLCARRRLGGFPGRGAGDPRAVALLGLVRRAAPKSGQLAVAEAVLAEVRRKSLPEPNIDFAVATLARVAGMVPGAGEAVFAVARTAGWIAHALEAYAGGGPLRPRAVYTGPPAIIDP
jgi:citrate synthase